MIRVGVDARCLNCAHLRGMGKYLFQVIRHASAEGAVAWELFAQRPDLPLHLPQVNAIRAHCFETRGYRFHRWEQLSLPRQARRRRVDALHCPSSTLPWWQPQPTIVTVHDVLPWVQNEPGWPRGVYLDRLLPRALRKCAGVITDSEHSRREILRLWPKLVDKLHVIPLGVAEEYLKVRPAPLSETLCAAGVRQPYLLYVGGEIPRKRLDWALQVLQGMGERRLTLVICGVDRAAQSRIYQSAPSVLRADLCFLPFVPEAEMPQLYQNAAAVLYPTLYEGFGLPALEAQAVGTPVLFSEVGGLLELRGPGAVIMPLDELDCWVAACRELVKGRGNNPAPDQAPRTWARRYSWESCSARHLEVYRNVVRRRSYKRTRPEIHIAPVPYVTRGRGESAASAFEAQA
jgi:alpha-1,3-rhamnosyl/mannosyltransferase